MPPIEAPHKASMSSMVPRQPLMREGEREKVLSAHSTCERAPLEGKYYGKPCVRHKYLFPLLVSRGLSLESAVECCEGAWVPLCGRGTLNL